MGIRMKSGDWLRAAAISAIALGSLFTSSGNSAIITPGGPAQSTPGAGTFAGLTPVELANNTPADETYTVTAYDTSNNARYTAQIQSEVLRDPSGTLDFAYQVTNLSTPEPDAIHTVSLTSYRNFTTDVDYVSSTGAVTYDTVQRMAPGNGITLTFDYTPAANAIATGDSTDWIIIKTNATHFDNLGTVTTIDGATATVPAFEATVPEPASVGLLSLTALLLGRRASRRQNG